LPINGIPDTILVLTLRLEIAMGYRIMNISQEFRSAYEPRPDLDGPFFYDGNRVLYYDTREGKYLNPQTDMYLTYDEYQLFAGI
jgi:hypothetical protein